MLSRRRREHDPLLDVGGDAGQPVPPAAGRVAAGVPAAGVQHVPRGAGAAIAMPCCLIRGAMATGTAMRVD